MTPIAAIRAKCLDCSGASPKVVKYCTADGVAATRCPLWPFRFGLRPSTAAKTHGADFIEPGGVPPASERLEELPR